MMLWYLEQALYWQIGDTSFNFAHLRQTVQIYNKRIHMHIV